MDAAFENKSEQTRMAADVQVRRLPMVIQQRWWKKQPSDLPSLTEHARKQRRRPRQPFRRAKNKLPLIAGHNRSSDLNLSAWGH